MKKAVWSVNTLVVANLFISLPAILVFFLAQRQFIRGITLSGLKG